MSSEFTENKQQEWNPDWVDRVPSDFPIPAPASGTVGGFQAKVLMIEYKGKYYLKGSTPRDRWERWDVCEDMAQQLKEKCLESKAGKRAHLPEVDILDQYFDRLLKTNWTSPEEARWITQRIAGLLSWPVPESANTHQVPASRQSGEADSL
ncbi:hypothetical protein [Undibacterium terreum]|uniref:Uncharacterized protein n=1 Tax=Undibacterium terreum TaxID=1224302 RepID=A0A916XRN7_9BURK|nr:hypothetical protein [Undibacterium terreum]GGC96672.1 hypothetical protein GCM10011396_50120 [Undibacterium terreum]